MAEPRTRLDLRTLLKWCRLQADEPDADPLWAKLADEIDTYLTGDPADHVEQLGQGEVLF